MEILKGTPKELFKNGGEWSVLRNEPKKRRHFSYAQDRYIQDFAVEHHPSCIIFLTIEGGSYS